MNTAPHRAGYFTSLPFFHNRSLAQKQSKIAPKKDDSAASAASRHLTVVTT
jgi:hypothetical protein